MYEAASRPKKTSLNILPFYFKFHFDWKFREISFTPLTIFFRDFQENLQYLFEFPMEGFNRNSLSVRFVNIQCWLCAVFYQETFNQFSSLRNFCLTVSYSVQVLYFTCLIPTRSFLFVIFGYHNSC